MNAKEFAQAAHPHSWLLVADNLYEQSIVLHERLNCGATTQLDRNQSIIGAWPNSSRSTFLLAGFALENAVKAFLVYEHPQWVSNGVLARPLRSHALVALAQKSSLIPWPKRGATVLSRFEQGLESWARYPCAIEGAGTEVEQNLSPVLWTNYLALMHAYGKGLMALLQRGWDGPHGVNGYFEFQGTYLGAQPKESLCRGSASEKSKKWTDLLIS